MMKFFLFPNQFNWEEWIVSQCNTILESFQKTNFCMLLNLCFILFHVSQRIDAAKSSNRGREMTLIGATFDFAMSKCDSTDPF